jgi:CO/xanthine dehydrogenase Mo-binding subunit
MTNLLKDKASAGDPIPAKCAVIEVHVGELRQLFDAIDPSPFSDRDLDPKAWPTFFDTCHADVPDEGAVRFGWEKRRPEPRSMRDGRYLIGQGMAGAMYTHWRWPAQARVTLNRDGSVLVEAGTHDLGTGTYTILPQVAADTLGLPTEKVTVRLGDTRLPTSHGSIGSATAANAGASVMLAAKAARDKAISLARTGWDALFADVSAGDVVISEGSLMLPNRNLRITYADLLVRSGLTSLSGDGNYNPSAEGPKAVFSFSALFAEVRVDPDFGLARVTRFVGAYDCGQVVNSKTARSQAIGGIIWGVGQALLERSERIRRWVAFSIEITPVTWCRRPRIFQNLTCCLSVSSTQRPVPLGPRASVNSPRYQ